MTGRFRDDQVQVYIQETPFYQIAKILVLVLRLGRNLGAHPRLIYFYQNLSTGPYKITSEVPVFLNYFCHTEF